MSGINPNQTTRLATFIAALFFPLVAHANPVEDRSWHLLTKRANGDVASIEHGLTKHECEFAKARVDGTPATPGEQEQADKERAAVEAVSVQCLKPGAMPEGASAANGGWRARVYGWDVSCFDGQASAHSSGISYMPTDVESAECFQ